MTKLCLVWVGRERSLEPEAQLCTRYLKRIKTFLPMEARVVKPFPTGSADVVQAREGERVVALLTDRDYLVLLDERGKLLSSPGLAQLIQQRREAGDPRVVFAIGGSMGFSPALRQRADFMLSLSQMTLPHALARVMVLEQVYRALCINASHPYHHEG